MTSIIKCLEFRGRKRIGLRGHGNNKTTSSFNNGNFKKLLEFRANSGDNTLRKHLDAGKRNAMYTSKTSQNDLLDCIKKFIQRKIYEEFASQWHEPLSGIQIDEVTDVKTSRNLDEDCILMLKT